MHCPLSKMWRGMSEKRSMSSQQLILLATRESSFTMKYVLLHQSTSCLLSCWFYQTNLFFSCQKIQPVDSEYREGREYVLTQFVKEGSYGEVHGARDVNTGFNFAVKKVKQNTSPCFFHCLVSKCAHSLCFFFFFFPILSDRLEEV